MIIGPAQTDVSFRLDKRLLEKGACDQLSTESQLADLVGRTYVCAIGSAHLPGILTRGDVSKGVLDRLVSHLESEAVAHGARSCAKEN